MLVNPLIMLIDPLPDVLPATLLPVVGTATLSMFDTFTRCSASYMLFLNSYSYIIIVDDFTSLATYICMLDDRAQYS